MVVYGKQVIFYLIDTHPEKIKKIFVAKKLEPAMFNKIKRLGIWVERIDNKKAQSLSHGGNHQGFLAQIEDFAFSDFETLKEGSFLVVLYNITDIGNIGSIVRSGYALGVDGLVITGLKSIKMEGVVRRSSGAALDLPIVLEFSLPQVIKELQDRGFVVYGADMDGEDIRSIEFGRKRAIVLGSEGEGIPDRFLRKCDETVKISMKRSFDSLNVAAAAAIFIDRMRDE